MMLNRLEVGTGAPAWRSKENVKSCRKIESEPLTSSGVEVGEAGEMRVGSHSPA